MHELTILAARLLTEIIRPPELDSERIQQMLYKNPSIQKELEKEGYYFAGWGLSLIDVKKESKNTITFKDGYEVVIDERITTPQPKLSTMVEYIDKYRLGARSNLVPVFYRFFDDVKVPVSDARRKL